MKDFLKKVRDNIGLPVQFFFVRQLIILKKLLLKRGENKHLFILCPPYSGSTLLNLIISSSKNVSCNNNTGTREGQLLPRVKKIMFQKNRWEESITYPWNKIQNYWQKYWDPTKDIWLDKSCPNIMRAQKIENTFDNIDFIVMTRNPYAQTEGIIRRNKEDATVAAEFSIQCLKYQKRNLESRKSKLFITYEELSKNPESVKEKLIQFVPKLKDISVDDEFKSHNFKTKGKMKITNLNNEKIAKLSDQDIQAINKVYEREIEILNYFNYSIVKR
jgi:hypothetical protein